MVKPNSNNPTKWVDSVEKTTLQNTTLKNMVVSVKDKSSISSNKESVTLENNTTRTTPEQGRVPLLYLSCYKNVYYCLRIQKHN
jgi:hypothetical protein